MVPTGTLLKTGQALVPHCAQVCKLVQHCTRIQLFLVLAQFSLELCIFTSQYLVAAVLSEQLLLGRQVQILVATYSVPNARQVVRKSVRGNISRVLLPKQVTVNETPAQRPGRHFKLVRFQHLVRQRDKLKIEKLRHLRVAVPFRLAERRPNSIQRLHQHGAQLANSLHVDAVPNYEYQTRFALREQLQIHLKNRTQQPQIRPVVSTGK